MDCFWNVSTFSFFLVLLVFFLAFIAGFAYCIDCVNYLQADGVRDVFDCAPAAATDVQTTQSVQRWTQPSAGISARPRLLTRYTSSRLGCTQPLLLQLDVDLTVIRPRYAHSTTRLHCGLVNTQVTWLRLVDYVTVTQWTTETVEFLLAQNTCSVQFTDLLLDMAWRLSLDCHASYWRLVLFSFSRLQYIRFSKLSFVCLV